MKLRKTQIGRVVCGMVIGLYCAALGPLDSADLRISMTGIPIHVFAELSDLSQIDREGELTTHGPLAWILSSPDCAPLACSNLDIYHALESDAGQLYTAALAALVDAAEQPSLAITPDVPDQLAPRDARAANGPRHLDSHVFVPSTVALFEPGDLPGLLLTAGIPEATTPITDAVTPIAATFLPHATAPQILVASSAFPDAATSDPFDVPLKRASQAFDKAVAAPWRVVTPRQPVVQTTPTGRSPVDGNGDGNAPAGPNAPVSEGQGPAWDPFRPLFDDRGRPSDPIAQVTPAPLEQGGLPIEPSLQPAVLTPKVLVTIAVVPEPDSLALFAVAILGLGLASRARSRRGGRTTGSPT